MGGRVAGTRGSVNGMPGTFKPEATILPHQRLQLLPIATEKNEAVADMRLMAKLVLDHARQRVDAAPHALRWPVPFILALSIR